MMIRWEKVEQYLKEQLDGDIKRLKQNLSADQTATLRGRIDALEGLLQLPALLTAGEQSDEDDLPLETEINYGR